jgi:hypothetical protein
VKRQIAQRILILFSLVLLALLMANTIQAGADFDVYWSSARAFLRGNSPYQPLLGREGLVFKYPPWILPLFIPFSLPSLLPAKIIWAFGEGGALFYFTYWAKKNRIQLWQALAVLLSFWSVLYSHFQMGQFSLFVLFICLYGISKKERFPWVAWALSSKIFSVISLLCKVKWVLDWKFWMRLSFIVFVSIGTVSIFYQAPSFGIFREWIVSAGSGGHALEGSTRGWGNQGFPALLLRAFSISAENWKADLGAFLFFAVLLSLLWARHSKKLTDSEKWAGWLALGVVCHPLAWFHSFVLALPLGALSLKKSVETKSQVRIFINALGLAAIGLMTHRSLPYEFGLVLELASIKSWGVFICGVLLLN